MERSKSRLSQVLSIREQYDLEISQYREALTLANTKIWVLEANLQDAKADQEKFRVDSRELQKKLKSVSTDLERLGNENGGLEMGIANLTAVNSRLRKHHEIAKTLLRETELSPMLKVIDILEDINGHINDVSIFLADNLVMVSQELFQQEIDHSQEFARLILGDWLTKGLSILKSSPSLIPLYPLFVKSVFQIFMVNFCGSQVKLYDNFTTRITGIDEAAKTSSLTTDINRTHFLIHEEDPPKSRYLQELSHIFKAVSCGIPGSTKRSEFEGLLTPFFESLEILKSSQGVIDTADMVLAIARTDDPFVEGMAENAFPVDEEMNESDPKEATVAGTVSIGLMLRRKMDKEGGESTAFKPIFLPKFVLYSDLVLEAPVSPTAKSNTPASKNTNCSQDGRS